MHGTPSSKNNLCGPFCLQKGKYTYFHKFAPSIPRSVSYLSKLSKDKQRKKDIQRCNSLHYTQYGVIESIKGKKNVDLLVTMGKTCNGH